MEADGNSIAYDAVLPLEASPPHAFSSAAHSGLTSISSGEDGGLLLYTTSVVLRRVIHDVGGSAFLPFSLGEDEDKEVEFLSLSMDADEEDNDDRLKAVTTGLPTAKHEETLMQRPHRALEEPPWHRQLSCRQTSVRSPLLQLHQEIVDFCELISPTSEEHQLRAMAVQRVAKVIKSIWKQCQVNVFGSFATDLYLPTSDIDIVILDSGCCHIQSGLKALAKALTKEGVARNMQVIGKARVPIVKFVETESMISFDVSFDMQSGPEAAKFIKDALDAVPPLKPLCLVLKIFLQQRELNEVYSGGIGSYALLVMLLTYLQTHSSKLIHGHSHEQSRIEQNLGVLLIEFLEFYGRSLNIKDVGISCRDGGHFFKKKERGFFDTKKPHLLTVEDPQAPTNDIAKNSFNFQKVRFAFMLAHRLLTNCDNGESRIHAGLLARIVRVDEKLSARKNLVPSPRERKDFSSFSQVSFWHEHGHMYMQESQKKLRAVAVEENFPRGGADSEEKRPKNGKRKRNRAKKTLQEEEEFSSREERAHKKNRHSKHQNTAKRKHKKVHGGRATLYMH